MRPNLNELLRERFDSRWINVSGFYVLFVKILKGHLAKNLSHSRAPKLTKKRSDYPAREYVQSNRYCKPFCLPFYDIHFLNYIEVFGKILQTNTRRNTV